MDGVTVAVRGWIAAHKFLFWSVVAGLARWYVERLHAVYWHREASREQLVLKPRRPKDLYDANYALFAYDITNDCWVGHWRRPDAVPGMPSDETFAWRNSWDGIPFHEVEFSDQPAITFKVRAVALDWCRKNLTEGDGAKLLAAGREKAKEAVEIADELARKRATEEAAAEAANQVKH